MLFETQPDLKEEWMRLVWEELRKQSQVNQILVEKVLLLEKEVADLKKSAVVKRNLSEVNSEEVTKKFV